MKHRMVIDCAGERGKYESRLHTTDRVGINSGGLPLVKPDRRRDQGLRRHHEALPRVDVQAARYGARVEALAIEERDVARWRFS